MKVVGTGGRVYWARTNPETGIFEVCELIVRTVYPECFIGVDKDSKRAHIISYDECDETVFDNREDAIKVINEIKSDRKG